MQGWLVYSPEGYARNRWFADRILELAAGSGAPLELRIVPADGLPPLDRPPDFVVMRAIRPDLSAALEARGVRVFNNAATSRIANDKWETFRLAREMGVPVMPTARFSWPDRPPLAFPYVLKSLDGHGGGEVFLVRDEDGLAEAVANVGKRDFIAQPLCDEPGVDVRVYMLDGRVLAAIRRRSRADFRSNFSLGGSAEVVDVDTWQLDAVQRLHGRLGFFFAGVDFIRHGGRWTLNEIEDVVGTRMLYAAAGIDAASAFVSALGNNLPFAPVL